MSRAVFFPCILCLLFLALLGIASCNDEATELPPQEPETADYSIYQKFADGRFSIYGRWEFVQHFEAFFGSHDRDFQYLEFSPTRQFRIIRNDSIIISGSYENIGRSIYGEIPVIEFTLIEQDLSGSTTFLQYYTKQWLFFEAEGDILHFTDPFWDGQERLFEKVE